MSDLETEVYIRFNADNEKDYCFAIPHEAKVSHFSKIIDTLPILLSPCYFYDASTTQFAVSVHPGHLTAEGSMYFADCAHDPEYQRPISSDKYVRDEVLPGQLVVPVWRWNYRRWLVTVTILLAWLYLDFPEYLSPTPGYAPQVLFFHTLVKFFPKLSPEDIKVGDNDSHMYDWLFFLVHVLKVGFIYLLVRFGTVHPWSLNPFKKIPLGDRARALNADILEELGWTGCRRRSIEDWVVKHRDHVIQRHGGILSAHQAGVLKNKDGLDLQDGEGWSVYGHDSAAQLSKADIKFLNAEHKFVVSKPYLDAVEAYTQELLGKVADNEEALNDKLKEIRTWGFLDGPKELTDLFSDLMLTHHPDYRLPKNRDN